MKTEISRDSHQPDKRYSGVYQQLGRMLTDADWNELVEILKQRLIDALKDVVGNGSPLHRNVINNETDPPNLQWGYLNIDGIQAVVSPNKDATLHPVFEYQYQEDFPGAPDLPSAPDNNYTFYADVWERTVTHLMDERLRDKGLHGADTCTRKQIMAQVKWCLSDNDPEQSAKNPAKGDAKLSLKLLQESTQPDPCDPCASQLDVDSKVGNYLFRVEVHDVKGDANNPSEITLKWSSENGAEQFQALPTKDEMPAGFINDKWVYEFFDQTSEKHLGVHLVNTTWAPVRVELTEIKEPSNPYTVPTIPELSETEKFVRRWDGYCRLDLSGTGSISGVDRGVVLSTSKAADSLGYVNIGDSLQLILDSIKLDMELKNKTFVAGDYWLAEVREAEHNPLDAEKSKLIENELPHGIEHHYLTLGKVEGGELLLNPEADRKYAFPSLTEMTRMFHVGGDGQEAMPNHLVPQSLKIGVTNGEWPVAGARVEFRVAKGRGLLKEHPDFLLVDFNAADQSGVTTTNEKGMAKCGWELGSDGSTPEEKILQRKQIVAVRLLNPNHDPSVSESKKYLDHPPVHFYANLSTADQVTYVNPVCTDDSPSVNSLLQIDSNDHGVFPWPDLDDDGDVTVKDVLDALLCKLRARHIPYDPTNVTRWNDINLEEDPAATPPETVQDAIDDLLENLHSEDIKYLLPDCSPDTNTFKSYIVSKIDNKVTEGTKEYARINDLWTALLCHLNAARLPYDPNSSPVTRSRWKDIKEITAAGDVAEPNTVQEAIDNLIKWLESTDIRYEVPNCGTDESPTVRSLLQISPGQSKVDDILDQLLCYFNATDLPLDKTSSRLCDKLKFSENVNSVQDALNVLCKIDFPVHDSFRLLFDWGVLCGIVPSLVKARAGQVRITAGAFMDRSGRITKFEGGTFDLNKLELGKQVLFNTKQALNTALANGEACLALDAAQDGETVSVYVMPTSLAYGPDDPGFRESAQNCLKEKEIIKLDNFVGRLPKKQRAVANKILITSSGDRAFSGSAKLAEAEAKDAAAVNDKLFKEFQKVASKEETEILKARVKQAKKDNLIGNTQGIVRQVREMQQATAIFAAFLKSDEERLRRCVCEALFPTCPPDLGAAPFLVPIACLRGSLDNVFLLEEVCPFCCRKQALTWRSLQYFIGESRERVAKQISLSCCDQEEEDDGVVKPGQTYDPGKYDPLDIAELADKYKLLDKFKGWPPRAPMDYQTKITVNDLSEADAKEALIGNGIEITTTIDVDDPKAFEVIEEKSVDVSAFDQLISAGTVRPGDKVGLLVQGGVARGYVLLERGSGKLPFPAIRTAAISSEDALKAEELINATNTAKGELSELITLRETLSMDVISLKTDVEALDAEREKSVGAVKEVETQLTELAKTRAEITKEIEAVNKELTIAEENHKKIVAAVRESQPVTVVTGNADPALISKLAGAGVTTVADISKLTPAKITELTSAGILNARAARKLKSDAETFLKRPLG